MDVHQEDSKSQGSVVSVSIIVSIAVFFITLGAGIISDSITLLLDASAEFIMVFMAFMLRSTMKKIRKPPDQFFNFGYEKFEPFTVVIQGAMLMTSCLIASYFAIQDIVHADEVTRYDIPTYASLTSGVASLLTAFYMRIVSLKTHSNMLKASSLHWFVDSSLSFAMCIGFLFGFYMNQLGYSHITPYVDPVMALVLAAIFVWTPLRLIKNSLRQLLDAVPAKEIRDEIEKIVEKHKAKAFGIYNVRMRKAGVKIFLDVCFEIHGHTTLEEAQEFVKSFEGDVATQFPKYDIIVHFHPV